MKRSPCSRLFEAEAARDGRLTGVERENFERHAAACSACARELAELTTLAEILRRPGAAPGDELRAHREKTRLLAAFDRRLLAPPRRTRLRSSLLSAAAVLVLIVAGFGLRRLRSRRELVTVNAPPVVVRANAATVWSEREEGSHELVVLERGTLWVRVDHTRSERQLRVNLPDGELEDIGTTFTVTAEAGHTSRIAVQEGRVVLRLRNQSALTIGAGEHWTRPEPLPAPPTSTRTTSQPSPDAGQHAASAPSNGAVSAASAAGSAARANDASAAEFRQALAALNRGDNAQAAKEFGAFLQRRPHDGRAEDAAYLRVIALQRSGDHAGLDAAAEDFLRRYPSGFRRSEVEGLRR